MPLREENFSIPGPAGTLEIVVSFPEQAQTSLLGVVCHPHPLFEGTMNNKVVHRVARTLAELGMITARFNFRGVEKSTGKYDNGKGETDDLFAVMQWMTETYQAQEFCIAGFSFGGYIAYRGAALFPEKNSIKTLVTIAPAVTNFDFHALPKINCPWLIIQGEQDEIVDPNAVYLTLNRLAIPHQLITLPNVGHFFHGALLTLQEKLLTTLPALIAV